MNKSQFPPWGRTVGILGRMMQQLISNIPAIPAICPQTPKQTPGNLSLTSIPPRHGQLIDASTVTSHRHASHTTVQVSYRHAAERYGRWLRCQVRGAAGSPPGFAGPDSSPLNRLEAQKYALAAQARWPFVNHQSELIDAVQLKATSRD